MSCVHSRGIITINAHMKAKLSSQRVNTLRPRQNGRHFADDMFKCIFLNENVWITIIISLKFVPKGSINNNTALFQIMAWRRPGDKPLSEQMMVSLLMHICVTRPQWVNHFFPIESEVLHHNLKNVFCNQCIGQLQVTYSSFSLVSICTVKSPTLCLGTDTEMFSYINNNF